MICALLPMILFQGVNSLTVDEKKAGWELLFDGSTTKGWHNYRKEGVGNGWVVKDGILTSEDPGNAGDIVTDREFAWFELSVDYRLQEGQNSGIMIRVAPTSDVMWYSGPEIQIYDDHGEEGAQKSGFLYEMYGSSVDATKPVGEWNTMRILVSPKHCETDMNGVKYYDYVYGSDDFWARQAKTKFAAYPEFGKANSGAIGIQGDHGVVSFRNIKIRPIKESE